MIKKRVSFSKFTRGDPCNPALVFLHGFLGCKEDWEEMLPFFEQSYFCVALDLPGHGRTPYSEKIIHTLREELLQLKEKPTLIGYSMGGRLALECMDIAKALVILSGHPGLHTEQEKQERVKTDQQWSEKLLALPLETFLSQWYTQPLFHSMPRSVLERRMKQDPQALSAIFLQLSLAHQRRHRAFSCPTLFLYGEYDEKYRKLYFELSTIAAVREVQKCGHTLHFENAAGCAERILNWLSEENGCKH
jgi:2-succinyl-6-hydroxy-2,4-cyclohexadiene-1-carboxylate synthase